MSDPSKTTNKTHGWDGAITHAELDRRERETFDKTTTTVRCAHCPEWEYTGPAGEARAVAAEHRRVEHRGDETCRFAGCHAAAAFGEGPCIGLCQEHAEQLMVEQLPAITATLAAREQPAKIGHQLVGRGKQWTRDAIIEAIRAWVAEHGELPYAAQWRSAEEGRPTEQTVRNAFGSWDDAMEAVEEASKADAKAVLSIIPTKNVSGAEVRDFAREAGARLSEDPLVEAVHIKTEGTVDLMPSEADPPAPATPVPAAPCDPFEQGMVEGMRATYVELLLDRLGAMPYHTEAWKLMDRIERLLWPSAPPRTAKPAPFNDATDDLGELGAHVEKLLARRTKFWDGVATTEIELEPLLVRIRRVADEWILNELDGPTLEASREDDA